MGDTYYVDLATGDDLDDGLSEGNAWASIGKAMGTVAAGDVVQVKGGADYTAEHGASDSIGQIQAVGDAVNTITFIGYTTTIGDGTFACVTLNAGANALATAIDGSVAGVNTYYSFKFFRFTGGSGMGVTLATNRRSLFELCRFDNNGDDGASLGESCILVGCQADNNTDKGIEGLESNTKILTCIAFNNGGIGLLGSNNAVYMNSIAYNNSGGQISTAGSSGQVVMNSTVDGVGSQNGLISFRRGAALNNIIYDCVTGIAGDAGNSDGNISLNNLFFSNDTDRTNWPSDASDVSGNPLFLGEGSLVEGSDGKTYKCIQDIVVSVDATHKPVTGGDWASFFRLFHDAGGLGDAWQTGVAYTGDTHDYRLGAGSPALAAGVDVGELTDGESFNDIGAHQAEAEAGGGRRPRIRRHGN